MKIRLVKAELFHADRLTNMPKQTVSFLNFSNAPEQPILFNMKHATQRHKLNPQVDSYHDVRGKQY
jgi:hypothetical protein